MRDGHGRPSMGEGEEDRNRKAVLVAAETQGERGVVERGATRTVTTTRGTRGAVLE